MKPQLVPVILGGRRGTTPFTPARLFTTGVAGAWYDPSDYSTLFQDSAGTTPVTAVEQPVGLMLDKSQGLMLGSELVTNGDFSGGSTGWTADASVSFTGGAAVFTASAGGAGIAQTISVPASACTCSFTVSGASAGGLTFRIRTAGGTIHATFSTENTALNKTYSFVLFPASTSNRLEIISPGGAGSPTTLTLDNVTIKSLAGNHASQATAASRPILRARYNLLTYSEDYSNAVWSKTNLTRTTGVADPFGGTSATTLTASGGTGRIYFGVPVVANANYTGSFYIRRRTGTGDINWEAFSVGVGALITTTGSWTRVTITSSTPITTAYLGIRIATAGDEIDVFAADFRPGSSAGTYQRIAAATDYATAGFLPYLYFVTDDSFGTNSIDFTATDKMFVCAGVTKANDSAGGMIAELGNVSAGGWILAPGNYVSATGSFYTFLSRGSAAENINQAVQATPYAAPTTNVLAATGNISGDLNTLRVNTVAGTNATGDQGTGNYGNLPLYIGRRNNASLPLNGNIYQLIVCGKTLSASELASTEAYVATKTGVVI